MRVHVVDDEASISRMPAAALTLEGHDVTTTTEGFHRLLTPEPW